MHLAEGLDVGHYRLLERLGAGGMGVVWRAEDVTLGRHAALKFLPAALSQDPMARERLLVEARSAATLDHPNICTVYEVGETEEGGIFVAMACYDGGSLKERLDGGPLDPETARDLAAQIARGLAAAHNQGIVHRDVKPSNVIVTDDGVAKLLDFGIAKIEGMALTRTGQSLGTLEYMAPEQTRNEADARTDVWALGIVLYEMLAGHRPFTSTYDGALLFDLLYTEPDFGVLEQADVPPPLIAIVRRCLEKAPTSRYPTAEALAEALDAVRDGGAPAEALPVSPEPAAPARRPRPPKPRPAEPSEAEPTVPQEGLQDAAGAPETLAPAVAAAADLPPTGGHPVAPSQASRRRLRIPFYVPAAMGGLLVIAIAALLLASRSSNDAPAALALDTTPAGAAVYLDGRHVGITPLRGLEVPPGVATVGLRLEGYADVDTLLAFEAGGRLALALSLAPDVGLTQAEAEAAAEEAAEAEGPVAEVPAAPGPAPGTQTAPPPRPTVSESRPPTTRPDPPAAPQTGSLVLTPPPGGSVSVDGQGGSGTVTVTAGRHAVVFRHPQHGEFRTSVSVGPGETKRLRAYFEGQVRVNVRLDGEGQAPAAAVTVNGQSRGFTPTSLSLGPGRHNIAVSRTGFRSVDGVQTVTIEPSLAPITRSVSFRLAPE